jgi:hypothetical protein
LLQCLGEIRDYGPFDLAGLTRRVFGKQVVSETETRIFSVLEKWGYGKTKFPVLIVCLHEVLLINRTPLLEDLSFDLLAKLIRDPGPKGRRYGLYRLSFAAHQLGLIEKPLPRQDHLVFGGKAKNLRAGIDPRWLEFMDRWFATTTIEERTRKGSFILA